MDDTKKIGKRGLGLHSQAKEIINNVAKFMEDEAKEGVTIPLKNFRERILAATGVSKNTLGKIRKEGETVGDRSFSSPKRKRQRAKKIELSIGEQSTIKNIIYDFYIIEKRSPTLKCIMQKLKDKGMEFPGGLETFRKTIISLGFRWRKTEDSRSVLIESHTIRLKRIEYLKQLIKNRSEGRKIVFTDETYIHSSHTQPYQWSDQSGKGTGRLHPSRPWK